MWLTSEDWLEQGKRATARVIYNNLITPCYMPGQGTGADAALGYTFTDDEGSVITGSVQDTRDLCLLMPGDTFTVIYRPGKSADNFPELCLLRNAGPKIWDKALRNIAVTALLVFALCVMFVAAQHR